jgi:uncharacterized protein YbcC (UPF0753/DUF2309 family)
MSDTYTDLKEQIEQAGGHLQKTWPLYSFVTSNPLSGFEDRPFQDAIAHARQLFGGRGYPPAEQFRQALEEGHIDTDLLREKLEEKEYDQTPEDVLTQLETHEASRKGENPRTSANKEERHLNQVLEKWLSVFLDEGRSTWSMPNRDKGFYRSWTQLATMDYDVPGATELHDLPEDKYAAISAVLPDMDEDDLQRTLDFHLTELPGWVGYIKQRAGRPDDEWSESYPIDHADYLAVRLTLADHLGATVVPEHGEVQAKSDPFDPVRECFLEAWEETYRQDLIERVDTSGPEAPDDSDSSRPDAQLVFCIDTRSEIVRRHIEDTGNYETHGYAGFFGVPVRRRRFDEPHTTDACPPVVNPEHYVEDRPVEEGDESVDEYLSLRNLTSAARKAIKDLQGNLPAAFSFVELSGLFYGFRLIRETLFPGANLPQAENLMKQTPAYEELFEPGYDATSAEISNKLETGLSLADRVDYAAAAFELMGWDQFAPVVVFAGHVSETSNNPFDSSLRCGACAGNSGVPNARILAAICNEDDVRVRLKERGFDIPDDTVFVPARHNTTTDEITLIDEDVGGIDEQLLSTLRDDLSEARRNATAERVADMPGGNPDQSCADTRTRAGDWAQTRPEWGLAGNASFLIGPNALREEVDLQGRAFLHSYDWKQDENGSALEQIICGPLVVCQWINHQYYFSTVDNGIYGSGSKITHNPVGNFGVLQGNGGDLMGGLPLQSLMKTDTEFQHEPLRITNLIHAPLDRVRQILRDHEHVRDLVENDWIDLMVIDPERDNDVIRDVLGNSSDEERVDQPEQAHQVSN